MFDKYKTLIKDTVVFAIGSFGSKLILFFLVPLYTNYLSTAEYGTADLVSTFVTLMTPITALSIEKAVIRFGMKAGETKENVLKTSMIVLLGSFMFIIVIIPILDMYNPISNWKTYLIVLIVLSNITEVERAYLKVKNKNKAYSIIGVLQTVVLAGSNIVLLTFLNTGVKGYLLSNIIALVVCAVTLFFAAGMHKDLWQGKIDLCLLKKMIIYSAPLMFSGISWWIMHSFDKVLIEWAFGVSVLGLYTASTKIPSLINIVTGVFNQAWSISSIRENETNHYTSFYSRIFDSFSFFLFGVGIFVLSIVKPLMSVYVGDSFKDSWIYVPFLIVSAIYYSIFAFCGTLYAALQKSFNDMWTSILVATMNILISCLLVKSVGVWGVIIGSTLSFFVFSIIRIVNIKKYIEFDIDVGKFIANTILILVMSFSITCEFYPVVISISCILVYPVVNYKFVKYFLKMFAKRF